MPVWEPPLQGWRLDDSAITRAKVATAAIGTAEIAELAVTNAEIADATITKLKIGDQEVDIQRMLDPVDWDRDVDQAFDETLDTTKRYQASQTSTIPSWAGEMLMFGFGSIQVTNTSGGRYDVVIQVVIDDTDTPTTGWTQSIPDSSTGTAWYNFVRVIVAPGSTIETRLWGWLASGSNTSNVWTLHFGELFKR